MSPSKVRSLARQYAGMTPSEISNHEDWVRRFKAERAEAEARKAEAERQYGVELQAMTDLDAVRETLRVTCDEYENDADRALQMLSMAGFVRSDKPHRVDAQRALDAVVRTIVGMIPRLVDPPSYSEIASLNELIMSAATSLSKTAPVKA
ncbi:hypothetical protein [Methylobacterium sp. J-077]|uniref:hypothetical protein n=1 Tax=Methylobacterium sp. J-077 TaxID=2836656 RepID=UPI001FB9887C|nr:hypothetical protein [Methylobacterium sp. J-077]MCJ2124898.1 hypothetical protein [Methylobacterium sp. J-077]